jgi:uncharacterized membrane protein
MLSVSGLLKNACVALVLSLGLSMTASQTAVRAQDGEEMMEDMCAGDMLWMIGWCLDMVMGDTDSTLAPTAFGAPTSYTGVFEPIEKPGATATRAFGINAQGDIVGSYTVGTVTHGYVLSHGVFTTIDYPGATMTEAWGINPRGDIIGRYTRGVPGEIRGFLLRHGRFTDISIGNHLITLPTKIGHSGDIVGCFHEVNTFNDMYGYVQRGSDVSVFTLPSTLFPAGSAAMHNGIVPGGRTVVGLMNHSAGRARGYVVTDNNVTYLDAPASTSTQAWDVNPLGTIVGQYTAAGRIHGFAYEDGGWVPLDVPGSTMTVARGINPQGDIVGVYNDAGGTHGFLLRR